MSNQPLTVAAGIAVSVAAGAVASTVGLEIPATLLVMSGVAAIDAIANRKATPASASEEPVPTQAFPAEVIPVPKLEDSEKPQPPVKPEIVASVSKASGSRQPRRKPTPQ